MLHVKVKTDVFQKMFFKKKVVLVDYNNTEIFQLCFYKSLPSELI